MIAETISHYKILDKLGAGATGAVYKAEDLERKRIVAVKCIHRKKLGTERDERRFMQEARALVQAGLDHASICAVQDVVETEDNVFIVMNFVIGQTLEQMLTSGPLELATAVDYAVQIAEGLQAAHDKGIVHRDLKSADIIVTRVGGVRITDFGLTAMPDRVHPRRGEASAGTMAYLAPEQLSGGEVDQQSDVWALGVILYEMVSGRVPFRGPRESVINAILKEEPKPLSTLRPDTPLALEAVVTKALAKKWETRYASAAEVLADLKKIQNALRAGETLAVAEPPKAPMERLPRIPLHRARSRRVWITVAAVVVVGVALALFFPRGSVPFAQRDWVVIADFDNFSGEAVFDQSLNEALLVSLHQSTYVNAYPRRRTEAALGRMGNTEAGRIDAETARAIAMHEGLKVVVAPEITGVGDKYKLTGTIQDARTGETLRSQTFEATGQANVIGALGDLASWIRGELGEGKWSISRRNKPLEEATTASLAALQQFSTGLDKQRRGDFDAAKKAYEQALRSDSTFALALGALGMLEWEHFDFARGVDYLNAAMEYVDRTTDLEGCSIRAAHAMAVDRDAEKAARIYRETLKDYPDASEYQTRLAAVYGLLGKPRAAVSRYAEAIRAEPTMVEAYDGLSREYLDYLGRVDSALVWLRRLAAYGPHDPLPYYDMAYAYVGADSLDRAASALERSLEFDAGYLPSLELLGHVQRLRGRYRDAAAAYARLYETDKEQAEARYFMGVAYQQAGDEARARTNYDWFRRMAQWRSEDYPDDASHAIELALVLTRLGQSSRAAAAARKAAAVDSTSYVEWARLRSVQGRVDDAMVLLQRAVDGGFRRFILIKYHPDFAAVRRDKRFTELEQRYLVNQG